MKTWQQILKTRYPARPPDMPFDDYADQAVAPASQPKNQPPKGKLWRPPARNGERPSRLDATITPEVLAEWCEKHAAGLSFAAIAQNCPFAVSISTVRNRVLSYREGR